MKCKIVPDYVWNLKKVYFYDDIGNERHFLKQDGTAVIIEQGMCIPDDKKDEVAWVFSELAFNSLVQALADEGIKTEQTHKIEGILQAQGKHLEDMRKLVFKKNKAGKNEMP